MAGTKKSGNAGEGRPWPFPEGAPKPKRVGDKVPCCNPRCPGVGGRQSFKWDYAVGRGQNGSHCVACNMAWKKSWNVHYNDEPPPRPPPSKRFQHGGARWADYEEDDDWEEDEPEASPAYGALDEVYKGLLAQIISLPSEEARQEAISHFKGDSSPVGKAMLAAYAETLATKQAVERPVLRHPAGDPAGVVDGLRRERNKAENLDRQAAAKLQRYNLQQLAIQERIAQAQNELVQNQKEQAEAAAHKEETSRDFALKDQQLQAAMAHRERELLMQTGGPAADRPDPFAGPGQYDDQAKQLVEAVASLATMVRKAGCSNLQPLLDALAQVGPALAAQCNAAAGGAPPTPPLEPVVPTTPLLEPSKTNMVDIQEGKRKSADDAGEQADEEANAVASFLGGEPSTAAKGGKKTKTAVSEAIPALAKTIADVEAISRLVTKNMRRPEGAASSSAEQQRG